MTAGVFAAENEAGGTAAVKLQFQFLVGEPDYRNRFQREADIAKRIKSPVKVDVISHGLTDADEPYLVMELLDGVTLADRFRDKGPVDLDRALSLAERLATGLAPFHEAGIVHRALSPANLILSQDDKIRVFDFGTALMSATDPPLSPALLGPPAFMSPEVACEQPCDPRSDVFSIGALLFWMLTEREVRDDPTQEGRLITAATTPAVSIGLVLPELPDEVVDVVDRALAWERSDRFESAGAFGAALHPLAARGDTLRRAAKDRVRQRDVIRAEREASACGQTLDGRVEPLLDLFRHLDQLLSAARENGWNHVDGEYERHEAFRAMTKAMAGSDQGQVAIRILPDGFYVNGVRLWQPKTPFDAIPVGLVERGIRGFTISASIQEHELDTFLHLLFSEGPAPWAEGDDLTAAIFSLDLKQISVDQAPPLQSLISFEGTKELTEALYELEEESRNSLQASSSDDQAGLFDLESVRARRTKTMPFEREALAAHAQQLTLEPSAWQKRFPTVLTKALSDAQEHGDLMLVVKPFNALVAGWLSEDRVSEALVFYRGLVRCLPVQTERGELLAQVFGPKEIQTVVSRATQTRRMSGEALQGLTNLLEDQGARAFEMLIETLPHISSSDVRDVFVGALGAVLGDRVEVLGGLLQKSSAELALPVLALLSEHAGSDVLFPLRRACKNPDPDVWSKALSQRLQREDKDVWRDLDRFLAVDDEYTRLEVLRLIRDYGVATMKSRLGSRISDPKFASLSASERQLTLQALAEIAPAHAEQVAIELVKRRSLVANKERDTSRVLGVELLGKVGRSPEAIDALQQAARPRWWNSKELQAKAQESLASIETFGVGEEWKDESPTGGD